MPRRLPLERHAAVLLGVPTLLVFVAYAAAQAYEAIDPSRELMSTFGMDGEHNLPAYWNAILLLAIAGAALLLAVLTPAGRRPSARIWLVTGLGLGYLSLDEALSVHEHLGDPVNALADRLGTSVPTFAWVLPGIAIVAAGAVLGVRWFAALPRDVRLGLVLAAGTYLTGALVVESVNGALRIAELHRLYAASSALEELLEMTGCVLATCVLLRMVDVDPVTRVVGLRPERRPDATPTTTEGRRAGASAG